MKQSDITSEETALQWFKERIKESKEPNYKLLQYLDEKEVIWVEEWDKLTRKSQKTDLKQGEINDLIIYTNLLLVIDKFRKYLKEGKNYTV